MPTGSVAFHGLSLVLGREAERGAVENRQPQNNRRLGGGNGGGGLVKRGFVPDVLGVLVNSNEFEYMENNKNDVHGDEVARSFGAGGISKLKLSKGENGMRRRRN